MQNTLNKKEAPNPHSHDSRLRITKMVMKLFEKWEIDTKSQLTLLGLKPSSRAVLSNYKNATRALPDDSDKLDRAGLLLLIHKCLRLLFPRNPELVYRWISSKNKAFDNATPIEIIKNQGLIGLARVARYLEFQLVH